MADRKMNARIQHKHDTEANWLKATNFIPLEGELIIYDADENNTSPRFKVGDGETVVSFLPFTSANSEGSIVDGDFAYFKDIENIPEGSAPLLDADSLGGISASSYMTYDEADANYLLKTEIAANSSLLGGKAPIYYIQPRNLLNNSDFRNPVNQRGQTTYTGSSYGLDRWTGALSSSSQTIELGYVTFERHVRQYVEDITNLLGKSVTVACEFADGTIFCNFGTVPTSLTTDSVNVCNVSLGSSRYLRFVVSSSSAYVAFIVGSSSTATVPVKWVALYEGEYTADNLPPYVSKGYAVELAECQRYYLHNVSICMGQATSSTLYGIMPTPVKMRITPSVINLVLGTVRVNAKTITPTSVSVVGVLDSGVRMNVIYESTTDVSNFVGVWVGTCGLSADL